MKVAFISATQGLFNRGAENSIHFIANNLTQLGCEVSVYGNGKNFFKHKYKYYNYRQQAKNYAGIKKFNLYNKVLNRLYLTKQSYYLLRFLITSLKDVKNFNPDIAVLPSPEALLFYKIFYKKVKMVVFSRAGIGFHTFDLIRLKPNLFISITPDLSEYKKRVKKGTKLKYIPNGVDLSFFKKTNIKSPKLIRFKNKNKPIVLCVAALVPYKRIDKLIKACAYGKYYLIIAGKGPLKSDLKKQSDELLGKSNYHIATFSKQIMPQLYNLADITVLPSKSLEAFGNVLIESMACGTPVLANKDFSRKKIVGVGGELVNCGVSKKIYKGIEKVLKNKNKYKCKYQASKFNYKIVTKNILKEFTILLNEK